MGLLLKLDEGTETSTGKGLLFSSAPLWLLLLHQHEEDQSASRETVPNCSMDESQPTTHWPKLCFLLSAAVTLCTLQVSRDKICFCQIRLILTATLEREGELKDSKFSVVKGFKSEVQGPNNSFSEYYVTIKTWKNCPVSWRAEIMSGGFPENILIGLFGHIPLVTQSTFQNCPVFTLEVANSLLASSL